MRGNNLSRKYLKVHFTDKTFKQYPWSDVEVTADADMHVLYVRVERTGELLLAVPFVNVWCWEVVTEGTYGN